MLQTSHTLDLVPALFCWTMLAALEMKQTSHNASTMGWEFTTVYPAKMLVFSATQVSMKSVEKSPQKLSVLSITFMYMCVCIVDASIVDFL